MASTPAIVRGARAMACAGVLLLSAAAHAQSAAGPASANDKVAAEALFEDGRRLVAAGSFAEACPKFADSQRLDPSVGTLLNLASCYEKLGRSATAWATYREAASAANATGRAEYVATAQRHADGLAPTLAHLTVSVAAPVEGMQITRDGVRVERAEWGLAIPIDAGTHTLEATAPGHKSWSSTMEVKADGAQAAVAVPALEAVPVEAAPVPLAPAAPLGAAPGSGPPAPDVAQGGGQRTAGIILGVVGLAGLATGGVFAALAKSKYNTSLSRCESGQPDVCDATGVSQRDDARTAGNVATVAASVGAAALVGGVVVWLTAPRGSSTVQRGAQPPASAARVGIAPTLGGAVIQGVW